MPKKKKMTTVQYLRVKRPRKETAPKTLRLEGLHEHSQTSAAALALSGLSVSSSGNQGSSTSSSRKRPTAAVLTRVTDIHQVPASSSTSSYHVVDAVLDQDESSSIPGNKRRRLTLVASKTLKDHNSLEQLLQTEESKAATKAKTSKKKKPLKVLNPLERKVDESLKQVYQGEISPRQHFDYLSRDESLVPRRLHWLAWSNAEMGNLLHACALWNDSELAAELLNGRNIGKMGTQMDGDGRTPYQIAELMGHELVIQVLEAFGADISNYVYDIYCIDGSSEVDMTENQSLHPLDDNDSPVGQDLSCHLKGGYGYWDEDGQLMLEAFDRHELENDGYEKDEEEDDEDSNDEGHVANDYPDEEDEERQWGSQEDGESDDEDILEQDNTFRHAPVDLGEEDFDAAYGIYGQSEP